MRCDDARGIFEGVKVFWHGKEWDIDAFWLKPVIVDPFHLDNWDTNQNFTGAWATYKPKKGTAWDFYILNLINAAPVAVGQRGVRGGFSPNTTGSATPGGGAARCVRGAMARVETAGKTTH